MRRAAALVAVVVAVLGTALAWSFGSPVGASPDEPTHVVHSWGVVTGQTLPQNERVVVDANGVHLTLVDTPAALQEYHDISCYLLNTAMTPSCGEFVVADGGERTTTLPSYMTRYPPLYYAGAGLVLRAGLAVGLTGHEAMLAARVASAAVGMAAVLGAAWVLRRRFAGPGPAVALVAGLTPVTLSLFGAVNPNGLEIGAAVLCAALVVAVREDRARTGEVGRALLAGLVLATAVLVWTRPLSLVWAALLLAVLLLPGGLTPDLLRGPLRRRAPTIAAAVGVVAVLAAAAVWTVWATETRTIGDEDDETEWTDVPFDVRLVLVVLKFGSLINQMVGFVGSDTSLPQLIVLGWLLTTAVAVVALATGSRGPSTRVVHVGLFGVGAVAAVAGYSLLTAFGWQGRYWLPAAAAALVLLVPSLEGRALGRVRAGRVGAGAVAVLLTLQVVAFVWHLWRYVYGVESQYRRFDSVPAPDPVVGWLPPAPQPVLMLLLLAGGAALAYLVLTPTSRSRDAAAPARRPAPEATPDA